MTHVTAIKTVHPVCTAAKPVTHTFRSMSERTRDNKPDVQLRAPASHTKRCSRLLDRRGMRKLHLTKSDESSRASRILTTHAERLCSAQSSSRWAASRSLAQTGMSGAAWSAPCFPVRLRLCSIRLGLARGGRATESARRTLQRVIRSTVRRAPSSRRPGSHTRPSARRRRYRSATAGPSSIGQRALGSGQRARLGVNRRPVARTNREAPVRS